MSPESDRAAIDLIEPRLRAAFARHVRRPFVVGLCGAQGSGKSTISEGLQTRLNASGLKAAVLSIDDLYLPRQDRAKLAKRVHPLLRTRGVPGTHDVALGVTVIEALGRSERTALPRFAKEDDCRRPREQWPLVDGPLDILLFEGWCVGARPQDEVALTEPVNSLEREEDRDRCWRGWVNARLDGDYQQLFARIDWLVLLAAPGFGIVSGWRREQEQRLRAALALEGRDHSGTLSDVEVDRFVQHYQRITEHILAEMPGRANLCIALDEQRRIRWATAVG